MPERKPVDLSEWLYRRGYSNPVRRYMNPDGTATSRVFKLRENDNGELSVDVKSLTNASASIVDPSKYFLFEISNISVLEIEPLNTLHDPLSDGTNPAHAAVIGLTLEDEIKPGLLARKSKRVYL
ncbi:hypothetical protein QWZ08_25065 [Ferruginibacter paludis]|uniref:hypothetical protein n=1 Tax=Ferruginibacter paludis TaxID=1310417 RepID=UPI0025B47E9C|nr:hypothetical protein [Ferruginibacter paludis]MDN3658939.1 hypothetical protein [Ferruginibacter paludis]